MKYLVPVSWTLWGVLFLGLSWAFVKELIEPVHSPEMSPGTGAFILGFLLFAFFGVGLLLFWATRRRSSAGVIALTLLLAYPVVIFPDPVSRALAEEIESGNIANLQRLLAEGPPPTVRDRAGNDLLAFAADVVRDRNGNPETVRILLEAGADPRKSSTPDGDTLLHFMVFDRKPSSIEVVRLLLKHGADPNARDPQSGMTPMANAGAQPEMV
jgi:hypothetical protein